MLIAKLLLMDSEDLAWTIDAMHHSDRQVVTTRLHLLLKVKGDMFDIDDFVIHKQEDGPVWKNIDGCRFLDLVGIMNMQGKMLDIDWKESQNE